MSEGSDIFALNSLLRAGTQLNGIYEIDSAIATGGMGEIYKGHEIQTGDPVAIKVIRADMADDALVLALFRKEASALNRIHHEAIVRYFVFSLDPILRRHYLAMEFVEGESLASILKRAPLDVVQVHALQTRLASGLQAAHDRHIIHRDVSPDNVIVSEGDVAQARIIDFGIARSNRVGDLTVLDGGFAGKYGYVSPEQLGMFDGNVTGKSDIYSLGLVLANCLLGAPIDMGGSQLAVVEKRRCVPDLSKIDLRMRPLLKCMLQPDPANRPASMAEVASWPLASLSHARTIVTSRAVASYPVERVPDGLYSAEAGALKPFSKGTQGTDSDGLKYQISNRWKMIVIASLAAFSLAGLLVWTQFRGPVPSGHIRPSQNGIDDSRASQELIDAVKLGQFIHQFDGGECFLAVLSKVSAQAVEIDGYGVVRERLDALDKAFKKTFGLDANIIGRIVTPAQCPALAFLKEFLPAADAPPLLEVAHSELQRGSTLQATIVTTATNVFLFIIDSDGRVHNVTEELQPDPKGREFAKKIDPRSTPEPQSLTLLAIASKQPIGGLGSTQPLAWEDFFQSLAAEVKQLTPKPAMAARNVDINY
jgi:serine/threonine protein kinase